MWCTCVRISRSVSKAIIYGSNVGGGRKPLSRTFELFRARETRIFNLAKGADLIHHARIRLRSREEEAKLGETPREKLHTCCLRLEFPRNYFGSLSSVRFTPGIAGRIREHPLEDFHYQRQRREGIENHLVPGLKPDL